QERVSIVDGSSIVQNQKFRRRTSDGGRPHWSADHQWPRETMLSRRSSIVATQPMPPSVIAILRSGCRTGYPDQGHSAQGYAADTAVTVVASWKNGPSGSCGSTPPDPKCRQTTVSVSTHASMIGSQ